MFQQFLGFHGFSFDAQVTGMVIGVGRARGSPPRSAR